MAARVAEMASSSRCFFSFSSTSVAAPTRRTDTPPDSLASRSWSFSESQSESVVSISARICRIRSSIADWSPAPLMIVVESLSTTIRRAWPSTSRPTLSSLSPTSSLTTSPPVSTAMSASIALRRSPNPGAFTAATGRSPRILFTTSVDSASPSTSSATTSSGFLDWAICSSSGRKSAIEEILPACSRT